ncbi:MAG: type II secretion protein, partial [Halobacteriaceae archaeon]
MLRRLLGARTSTAECQCEVQTETAGEDGPLVIEASACPGEGQLRRRPGCRATAVGVVTDHGPRAILTRANGTDRRYGEPATTLLAAAGQTAIRVGDAEPAFATRARRDPLGAAHEASGRAGPIAAIAADTGLLAAAEGSDRYQRLLRPLVGLSIAGSFVDPELPAEARLLSTRTLADGTELKRYRRGDYPMAQFHVAPRSVGLSVTDRNTLAAAATLLTRGAVTDGPSAPRHAIEEAADDPDAGLETLADLLRRHTRGLG